MNDFEDSSSPWPDDLAPPLPKLQNEQKTKKFDELTRGIRLNLSTIQRVRQIFEDEMELGLAKNPPKKSSLQMENTYLPELTNGSEVGEYLSLDLGGTNFRVILLKLTPGTVGESLVMYYTVPENLRLGPGVHLFDFLADCIQDFIKAQKLEGKRLPLGFTFSFPMTQKGLDVGILVSWTKSFNCPGVVGEDAVRFLNESLKRKNIEVDVVAVLNDTTGTLVQGAWMDPECAIGMILGTGSNACYVEKVEKIEKWEGDHKSVKEVVIDIEWGAFGDNGVLDFLKTPYDYEVDAKSLLVHSFTFEKYFGGKYLGEIVRCIFAKLAQEGVLFDNQVPKEILQHGFIKTSFVSRVESDWNTGGTENTLAAIGELKFEDQVVFSQDDISIVKFVCAAVTVRGAVLVSTCLASLLDRMARPGITIAIDGSLYKHHPRLHDLLTAIISRLAPKRQFRLILAEDGSGKGAGLIAAIAARLSNQTY